MSLTIETFKNELREALKKQSLTQGEDLADTLADTPAILLIFDKYMNDEENDLTSEEIEEAFDEIVDEFNK